MCFFAIILKKKRWSKIVNLIPSQNLINQKNMFNFLFKYSGWIGRTLCYFPSACRRKEFGPHMTSSPKCLLFATDINNY